MRRCQLVLGERYCCLIQILLPGRTFQAKNKTWVAQWKCQSALPPALHPPSSPALCSEKRAPAGQKTSTGQHCLIRSLKQTAICPPLQNVMGSGRRAAQPLVFSTKKQYKDGLQLQQDLS